VPRKNPKSSVGGITLRAPATIRTLKRICTKKNGFTPHKFILFLSSKPKTKSAANIILLYQPINHVLSNSLSPMQQTILEGMWDACQYSTPERGT
jgi:hypothetical protein